jgi:hypothetical protein
MDVDVDGDGDDDDDDDDASSSKDPCRCRIDALYDSPSRSLSKARFHEFLVSLCVGSLFRLRRVGVFDEAKPPTPDTSSDTGGLCPYAFPLNSLLLALMTAFLPGT